MAEPTAPTAPTPCTLTVSAAKRTVTIANLTQLEDYFAGRYAGGLTWGDDVSMAVGSYAPASPLTLPAHTAVGGTQTGFDYITFRSANQAVLPASGVTPAASDAVNMPTIIGPAGTNGPMLVADNARNFRFVGIDFAPAAGCPGAAPFFQSPSADTDETTHPRNIIMDRCLLHFDPVVGCAGGQAISCMGRNCAFLNCFIYDFFNPAGGEPHVWLLAGGAGPYLIHQCEAQLVGCGVFLGDNTLHNPGVIPSDVTITENYLHIPEHDNIMGFRYNTGTAGLNLAGNVVTLANGGVVDPAWNDGSTYFILTGPRAASGHYKTSILINGVNVSGDPANSFRLATAWPDDGSRNAAGHTFHVTKWKGRVAGTHKNLLEIKQGQRVKIQGNIFARSNIAQQAGSAIVLSVRSEGSATTDILVQDNLVLDCARFIDVASRAGDGTGQGFNVTAINGSAGGLVTFHTDFDVDIALFGGNCEIRDVQGPVEANGIWPMTLVNSTTFTIPVTWSGITGIINPDTGLPYGSIGVYMASTPTARIAIKNNLVLNPGSAQALLYDGWPNQSTWAPVAMNTCSILVATGGVLRNGGDDATLSTTGTWANPDIAFEHNTIVGPRTQSRILGFFNAYENNNSLGATDYKNPNWTCRNNVVKATSVLEGGELSLHPLFQYYYAATNYGFPESGTAALDRFTNASRNFNHNVFFEPWQDGTDLADFTGTDDDTLAIVATSANVGFTSYSGTGKADIANFVLANLYNTGTCTVTNGSTTVTFGGGASLPTTIVKGVPFKGPDNLYYLVESRISATQLTLQTAYQGATASGAYTLGFRGWSSDGSDPGCNITTLAAAIANAGVGSGSGSSGGGDPAPVLGALALTGRGGTLGFALIPQTP